MKATQQVTCYIKRIYDKEWWKMTKCIYSKYTYLYNFIWEYAHYKLKLSVNEDKVIMQGLCCIVL